VRSLLQLPMPDSIADVFGEVISSYSRAQALEDGVLVDLTEVASDVCAQHFKYPVACTAAVWEIIAGAVERKTQHNDSLNGAVPNLLSVHTYNDLSGVVHDILWMSKKGIIRRFDASSHLFQVVIRKRKHALKIVCGPGDDGEPVLTVMTKDED
jgi:hypothetical protein